MTMFFTQQELAALVEVPPVSSLKANGEPHQRPPRVLTQLPEILRLHQSIWVPRIGKFENESAVFIARHVRPIDSRVLAALLEEISRRVIRISSCRMWNVDDVTAEWIVSQIEMRIIELVMLDKPSRMADLLEVCFARIIERRTIDAVRGLKRSPIVRGGQGGSGRDGEDGNWSSLPITLIPSQEPGPEENLLRLGDGRKDEQLRIACRAVKNKVQLEATILHYGHGWPIVSKDPLKNDLVRHYGVTEGEMKYWLSKTMKIMRQALGVEI